MNINTRHRLPNKASTELRHLNSTQVKFVLKIPGSKTDYVAQAVRVTHTSFRKHELCYNTSILAVIGG